MTHNATECKSVNMKCPEQSFRIGYFFYRKVANSWPDTYKIPFQKMRIKSVRKLALPPQLDAATI